MEEDDIYDNMEKVIDAKKTGAGISAIALYGYQAMAEDFIWSWWCHLQHKNDHKTGLGGQYGVQTDRGTEHE